MPPNSLPVSRASTVIPYADFLASIGAPVERELERSGLPPDLSAHREGYVSSWAHHAFLERMARSQGIEDLGLRVAHACIHDLMTAPLVGALTTQPTLLQALQTFIDLIRNESSGMDVWLSGRPDDARLNLGWVSAIPAQAQWEGLMAMIETIRFFAGPDWEPELISSTSTEGVPAFAHECFPHARIIANQPAIFFSLPNDLLSLGLSEHASGLGARAASEPGDIDMAPSPTDVVGVLRHVLQTYLPTTSPSLSLASEITGLSERTLQRRFAEAGVTYRRVVDDARFAVASQLLSTSDLRAIDVAHASGYADPSHFSRAFRRMAACTPTEYRRRQALSRRPTTA